MMYDLDSTYKTLGDASECKAIYDMASEPAILEQLAEELAELSQSSLKKARKIRGNNPTPKTESELDESFKEELADVLSCVMVLYSRPKYKKILANISEIISGKRKRWISRLKSTNNKVSTESSGLTDSQIEDNWQEFVDKIPMGWV